MTCADPPGATVFFIQKEVVDVFAAVGVPNVLDK
jgi:hypothetical protein